MATVGRPRPITPLTKPASRKAPAVAARIGNESTGAPTGWPARSPPQCGSLQPSLHFSRSTLHCRSGRPSNARSPNPIHAVSRQGCGVESRFRGRQRRGFVAAASNSVPYFQGYCRGRGAAKGGQRARTSGFDVRSSAVRVRRIRAGRRRQLSQPADQDHRLRSGRRRRRYRHAHRRQWLAAAARPAGGGRKSRRRRRQYRRGGGVHVRSGRLHAARRAAVAAHGQSAALQEDRLRSHPVRAGGDHDHGRQCAAGAAGFSRQDRAGIHRLRQGQSRQDQLCLARDRHHLASDRGAVREGDRHQARARALQGHGAGAQRPYREPRRL